MKDKHIVYSNSGVELLSVEIFISVATFCVYELAARAVHLVEIFT